MLRVVFFLFVMLICFQCEEPEPDFFISFQNNSNKSLLVNLFSDETHEMKSDSYLYSDYQYSRILVEKDSTRLYDFYSGYITDNDKFLHIRIHDKNIYDSIVKADQTAVSKSIIDYIVLPMDSLLNVENPVIEYP